MCEHLEYIFRKEKYQVILYTDIELIPKTDHFDLKIDFSFKSCGRNEKLSFVEQSPKIKIIMFKKKS